LVATVNMHDTIAAIATPLGASGIGIIRISGPDARSIAGQIFRAKFCDDVRTLNSHTIHLGEIVDPRSFEVIDQAMIAVFGAPHSYTGEDVIEFSCHGGTVVLRRSLEASLSAGARMAQPGEFTKRAFLNGRLDLAQAEAVNDLIRARTDAAQRVALRQLEGQLSNRVRELTAKLTDILAHIEASIDFPDDVAEPDRTQLVGSINEALTEIKSLIESADRGRIYREGARMVIAGGPNVGKSSLLNALLRESRAIVTPIPGTTRDLIEEGLNIHGVPVVAVDTAGLRETEDFVERIGVERAEFSLETADLVLYMVDLTRNVSKDDLNPLTQLRPKPVIVVLNKTDIADASAVMEAQARIRGALPDVAIEKISALTGDGLPALESAIAELLVGEVSAEPAVVSNLRHKASLVASARSLETALETLIGAEALDLASGDLMSARSRLGEITGETATEDILDRIFSEFCVGK